VQSRGRRRSVDNAVGVSSLARRPSGARSLLAAAPPRALASRTAPWRSGSWLRQKRRSGSANDRHGAPRFVGAPQACCAPLSFEGALPSPSRCSMGDCDARTPLNHPLGSRVLATSARKYRINITSTSALVESDIATYVGLCRDPDTAKKGGGILRSGRVLGFRGAHSGVPQTLDSRGHPCLG
jgi:hypothetical protein